MSMNLHEYFDEIKGYGILATSNSEGQVDIAIYAKPHIMDENTIAFIMPDRLTHHNLQTNPHAAFMFIKEEKKLSGMRLFLTKIKEEKDTELLYSIRRKIYGENTGGKYLVYFKIDKTLPLIGAESEKQKSENRKQKTENRNRKADS